MASATFEAEGGWRRWGRYAIPAALVILAAWLIWTFAHQVGGVRREAERISTIVPVEEPPPPPPTVKPPEPKPVDQTVPQPTPRQPQPTPQTPSPAQPTVGQNAVTQNAPAQAGSDAFNIGAGSGGGMRGSGSGGGGESAGAYGQYARGPIMRAVRASEALKGKQFLAAVQVWFDAQGRVTRVEFTKGTGVGAYDTEIRRVLSGIGGLRPPAASALTQMPVKFTIDERTLL